MVVQPPYKIPAESWKILIIDDDEDDYLIGREMLRAAQGRKCDVLWASTYQAGQKELLTQHYDAVLVDYDLGLHSGVELIREATQRNYPAPLILFTGRGGYEIDVEAMEAGASLYLTKDEANPLLLERAIRYAIERRRIEELARQSRARIEEGQRTLEALMEYIPEGITIADGADATIRMVSHYGQEMLGGAASQKTAEQVADEWKVYDPDGVTPLPAEQLPLLRAIHQGEVVKNQDLVQVNAQGQRLHLSCSAGPIRDASGKITGGVVAWRDISERREAELSLRESEAHLRQSEERFSKAFNANPNAQVISRLEDGRIEAVNDSFSRLFGYTREETLGKSSLDLHMFARPADREEAARRLKADRFLRNFELDIQTQSGEIRRANLSVELMDTGENPSMLTIIQDITEQKHLQQQQELLLEKNREQKELLEAVLQALPVGVWITDADGRITGKNEQSDRIWAGDAPLVEGVEQYREYQSWDAQTGKKLETEDFPLTRVLRTGQPVEPTEQRIRRFDGSEGYVLVWATPVRGRDGRLAGAVAINLDVTARRQAEEAVRESEAQHRESEAKMRAVFQALAEGVVFLNPDGVVEEVNEAIQRTYHQSLEELSNPELDPRGKIIRPDGSLFPVDEQPAIVALRTGQAVFDVEMGVPLSNGQISWRLVNAQPVYDDQGTLLGAVASFFEITERRKAELALKESEATLRESEATLRESEAQLRASEALLRDVLESTHDRVFLLDRDWRIQYANRRFVEAYKEFSGDFVGKDLFEVFPRYQGTILEQNYRKVMEERVPLHFEMKSAYDDALFEVGAYPTQQGMSVFAHDRTEENRARIALRESQERLEWAEQIAHLGSWELNVVEDRLTWSDEVYRIFGLQPQEFDATYEAFLDRVHPEDRAAVDAAYMNSVRENRDGYEIEHRIVRAHTGEVCYVHEKCEHFRGADGKIVRSVGMVHDITGRKQAEAALNANAEALELERARFAAAIEELPVGVSICDTHGNVLSLNSAGLKLHGFASQAEMFRRAENYQQAFELRFLDERPIPVEDWPFAKALRGDYVQNYEVILVNRQTRKERVVAYNAAPVKNSAGETTLIVYTLQDLTDQKEAEAALKRSLERERARAAEIEILMDTVPAMIWMSRDRECRDMTGNRYGFEFLGMWQGANISKTASEADLNLQPYRNFKDGREIPTDELPMQVAAATGRPAINYDFDLVFNDGTVRTVLGNVNPLFDEQGQPSGAVAAFMDITDRREVEEQLKHYAQELERSNQALQDFAFVASHDLQEPLRKILLFGDRLKERMKEPGGGKPGGEISPAPGSSLDYLQRMQSAAARMQAMIDGLLELSRVNTRGREFAPVNLNQVAAEVVSILEARIRAAGGKVLLEDLPEIEADELQMNQLLQNLIGNAIKFHRPGVPPVVRVSGKVAAGKKEPSAPMMAEIRVEDNGIGFKQELAGRIFQPFQRLHGRSEYEGSGLGLAICQKIVERHGGRIEVESAPGSGARFTIRLPVRQGKEL